MFMVLRKPNNVCHLAKATSQAVNAKSIGAPIFDEHSYIPINYQNWHVSGFDKILSTSKAGSCAANGNLK